MTEPAEARSGPGRAPFVLRSLRGYRREWVVTDVLAAVTLLAIAVPEQLATSRLAGMPPVTGFYAFVAGSVLFALLGSNARMSVGADSTIAPLFAVGVARFAASGTPAYEDLVGILAVLVGVLVAIVWLARLGWISDLLSAPIIAGFLAGIAVIIIVHQLPDLLGVHSGGGSTLHRIGSVISDLGHVSVPTLVIGLAVFGLVVAAERIDGRLPGALAGLVGATVVVALGHLDHHGVEVLGRFAHGAPQLGLRGLSWDTVQKLAPLAGVVALVVVTPVGGHDPGVRDRGALGHRRRPGLPGRGRRQRGRGARRRVSRQRQPRTDRGGDRVARTHPAGRSARRVGDGGGRAGGGAAA